MKTAKTHLTAALSLLLAAALVGCGGQAASSQAVSSAPTPTPNPIPAGMHMSQTGSVEEETYLNDSDYKDFLSAAEKSWVIPGLAEDMVPQGIGYGEATGRVYVSAYSPSDEPSVLMAVDETGPLQAEYHLQNSDGSAFDGHVGGVAVSDTTLYLSAKTIAKTHYYIAAIPLSDLQEQGCQDVRIETLIPVPISPSQLSYSDGILGVGNFYHPSSDYNLSAGMEFTTPSADGDYGCYLLGYRLGEEESTRLTPAQGQDFAVPDYVLAAPNKIQGMQVTNGRVVLSQSYGRRVDSALLVYDLDLDADPDTTVPVDGTQVPCWVLDSARQTARMTAMPMTEGLTLTPDGRVYVLFESGAEHYSDGANRTDHVWALTLP